MPFSYYLYKPLQPWFKAKLRLMTQRCLCGVGGIGVMLGCLFMVLHWFHLHLLPVFPFSPKCFNALGCGTAAPSATGQSWDLGVLHPPASLLGQLELRA